MADNTQLPSGSGGDTIRDVQRGGSSGPKTPATLLDVAGSNGANPERIVGDTGVFVPVSHAAASQADGHSATLGATADSVATTDTGTFSLVALFKRLLQKLSSSLTITGTVTADTELPAAAALADAASNPTTPTTGAALLVFNGATWDRLRAQSKRVDLSAVSIVSIVTIWGPAAGKRVRLMGGCISVSATGNVLFEDNSAGAGNFVFRTPKLVADTPYNFDLGNGVLLSAVNNVLKATGSGAMTITGTLYGCEE